jgi:hypothetical protein
MAPFRYCKAPFGPFAGYDHGRVLRLVEDDRDSR